MGIRKFLNIGAACLLVSGGALNGTTLLSNFSEAAWGNSIANNCTAMAFAPDGRLFVCQQNGALRVIDRAGNLLPTPFVTLTVDSNGERGLLGVAFDPAFATNHYIYVYHTVPSGPGVSVHNRIGRFVANGDVASGLEQVLVDLDNLSSATNHNGGAIHFGSDGKLYAAVGENANGANSQSLSNRLGKILRYNPDGTIITGPGANPTTFPGIAGSTSGANLAIWAVGLRNPFTFAFQPGTTRMYINDVGSNDPGANGNGAQEEVNDGIVGSNYAWPNDEGPASPPNANYRDPLIYYPHTGATTASGCAIVGAAFYKPDILQFPASYIGKYFYGDLCNHWIRYLDPSNNSSTLFASGISGSLVDIHVGPDGALYYLVQGGQVTRIQAAPSQALNISTRAQIGTSDNVLIGGFIVSGSAAKKVIVRARGPSLGVAGQLADPVLELHEPGNVVITNDDWQDDPSQQTEIMNSGLAPTNSAESAIVATLAPGNYTAVVFGNGGGTGIGLAEIFDLDPAASSQLGNISGRGHVLTGDNVMIGGFIVGNNIGAARVLLRARGPSITGVSSPVLADPMLELHNGNGDLIGFNDNWQDDPDQAALITDSGLAPTNTLESAILAGLAPGQYTAVILGKNSGTGIGIVEVFRVGP